MTCSWRLKMIATMRWPHRVPTVPIGWAEAWEVAKEEDPRVQMLSDLLNEALDKAGLTDANSAYPERCSVLGL